MMTPAYNLAQLVAAVCVGFALGVLYCANYARRRRNALAAMIVLSTRRRDPAQSLQDTINRLRALPNPTAVELHMLRNVDEFMRRAATLKKRGEE
jgi:hypothetical protein